MRAKLVDRDEAWAGLADERPRPVVADAEALAGLPEPARRYLDHSLCPAPEAYSALVVEMEGEFRLKRWLPFRARQILVPGRGFVWNATVGRRLRFRGGDAYWRGSGSLAFAVFGIVPVVRASGVDVARSAAGRLAVETVAWAPEALLPSSWVAWRPGQAGDDRSATVSQTIDGETWHVAVTIDGEGGIEELTTLRWGQPPGDEMGLHSFGGAVTATGVFDGVRRATEGTAGWYWGTDRQDEGEFFRYRIRNVHRLPNPSS